MSRFLKTSQSQIYLFYICLLPLALIGQPAFGQTVESKKQEGKPLELTLETEDINITYDRHLAREQVTKYPDNPEAHFVLAVALTRTSRIEEAFKEIRISRRLAQKLGGPKYFDEMIDEYQKILASAPEDNRVRYHLAWGYYMKAYLLAEYSKRVAVSEKKQEVKVAKSNKPVPKAKVWHKEWVNAELESKEKQEGQESASTEAQTSKVKVTSEKKVETKKTETKSASPINKLTAMEQVIRKASPNAVPRIKQYYELALKNLDELLATEPKDVWAQLYRAHLKAEYSGDLDEAMATWEKVRKANPTNPAAYFFLGEGYLKKGNLRECLTNVSKAVALRAIGN